MPPARSLPKKPIDELRSMAAPVELIDWMRKRGPDDDIRKAWVDAPRADWVPYLAVIRGIQRDTILRAACECAAEDARRSLTDGGGEGVRLIAVLDAGATGDRAALTTTEKDLDDLRLAMIAREQTASTGTPAPIWMFWAKLVLELARASGRGNPFVGISLTMRMLASAGPHRARASHTDLVARLREKLTLAG